ncbi:MAG: hypothetical protein EOQ56_25630 [Mesorhizobium sp.]|nr:MAG: hypothetical protein EOQ56_25630 [Mesorhizobium sp.]
MPNAIVIKSSVASTAPGLQKLRRDTLLDGLAAGGVPFLFDLAFAYGWPSLAAPIDGSAIVDLAEVANGTVEIKAGQTVSYAGGGFDFGALTDDPADIKAPAGCLSSIFSGNQYFMVAFYMKLPTSGNWNSISAIAPMFLTSTALYLTEADMVTIAQANQPQLQARRQTDGGAGIVSLSVTPDATIYDQVCQVAFWRHAAGTGLRVKSALGSKIATGAVGVKNTGDFSLKRPQFGVPDASNALAGSVPHRNAAKTRLYRGWIENLEISGRDPLTVLDADWARTIARGVFS